MSTTRESLTRERLLAWLRREGDADAATCREMFGRQGVQMLNRLAAESVVERTGQGRYRMPLPEGAQALVGRLMGEA